MQPASQNGCSKIHRVQSADHKLMWFDNIEIERYSCLFDTESNEHAIAK
jgi:hypothetical protein